MKPLGDFLATVQGAIRAQRESELERRSDGSFWCPKHESRIDSADPVLSCNGCVADADRRAATERRLQRVERAWKGIGLPRWPWARFGATSWQQSVSPRVIRAVTKWRPDVGMFIAGPTGSGKTSAVVARMHALHGEAVAWARELRAGPCPLLPALYVTEPRLVASRRHRPLGEGEAPLVDRAMAVPVLILDEVGSMSNQVTFEVIDERVMAGLPTVAIAGFPRDELTRRIGDHCVRRLIDGRGPVRCDMFNEAARG